MITGNNVSILSFNPYYNGKYNTPTRWWSILTVISLVSILVIMEVASHHSADWIAW
jgi:hypothetical protein